jgi:hypothetical protein
MRQSGQGLSKWRLKHGLTRSGGSAIEPLLQQTNEGARPAPAQTAAAFVDLRARHRSVRRARRPWQGHRLGSADENRGPDTARTRACEEREMTDEKVARLQKLLAELVDVTDVALGAGTCACCVARTPAHGCDHCRGGARRGHRLPELPRSRQASVPGLRRG